MKRIVMMSALGILLPSFAGAAGKTDSVAKGKELSFSQKGNCLACHMIQDGEMSGNVGPPLIQMKARYPKREVLRAQIWDASAQNPQSMMPPFGKHGIMTEEEIEQVVEYMYTL